MPCPHSWGHSSSPTPRQNDYAVVAQSSALISAFSASLRGRDGPIPEDGAALQVRVLFVESLQTVVGDLLIVTTVGRGEHSRLHLPFDLGFVEDVHQRRFGGRGRRRDFRSRNRDAEA